MLQFHTAVNADWIGKSVEALIAENRPETSKTLDSRAGNELLENNYSLSEYKERMVSTSLSREPDFDKQAQAPAFIIA